MLIYRIKLAALITDIFNFGKLSYSNLKVRCRHQTISNTWQNGTCYFSSLMEYHGHLNFKFGFKIKIPICTPFNFHIVQARL